MSAVALASRKRHAVIVLGMARTGSSAITRLLNLLGVDLGPEDALIPPVAHINAKGFYEHQAIMLLNDELLQRLGGTWENPPAPPPGWADGAGFDDLRVRASEILAGSFRQPGLWGFKDPRTCFTLPFWQPLVGPASYIICHRNPLEVAHSLERRDGISLSRGAMLWARYASAAALATRGRQRMIVGYEELFTHRDEVVASLADFIGRPGLVADRSFSEAVEEWVEPGLKHHAATLAEVLTDPGLAPDLRTLHLAYELAISERRSGGAVPTPPSGGTRGQAASGLDAAAAAVERRLGRVSGRARSAIGVDPSLVPPVAQQAVGGAGPAAEPAVAATLPADIDAQWDFIIMGFGATMLARMLATHPEIHFDEPEASGVRGAVRPRYLFGGPLLSLDELAYRIAAEAPDTKLIAVLEDPVAQATVLHRRAKAAGVDSRDIVSALKDQLWPAALSAARRHPRLATSYVVAGEYGRILERYLEHVRPAQLLARSLRELAFDPVVGASQIAAFLGVVDEWPIEPVIELPTWTPVPLGRELDGRLREHFAADASRLAASANVTVPWRRRLPRVPPRQTDEPPVTSLIVIAHDTPEEVAALLDSVGRHTPEPHELLLIDNGSPAPAAEQLDALATQHGAKFRRLAENWSFARACNYAVDRTTADEVLLLNSDCLVTPGWLSNLRAALASADDVAAVGPRSNSAHLAQGGIWLDDTSLEAVERFGRFFNRRDRRRWFEVEWLVGFTMLIRRDAFDLIGGFDGKIRTGAGEDRDLCLRLREAGYRLLCAGDTFVFHYGQRTYDRAGLNRTALRYGALGRRDAAGSSQPRRLLRRSDGRVYEVAGGVGWHVETSTALALIRGARPVEDVEDAEIDQLSVGEPICMVRLAGGDEVYLLQAGERRRITGEQQRIRRLPGLSIVEPERLERLTDGAPVRVEDALAPVPELPSLLPRNPVRMEPRHLVGSAALADAARTALRKREGFALIRLGTRELVILNEDAWSVAGSDNVKRRLGPDAPTARSLRQAIVDADAVGLPERRDSFGFAPLAEQLLFHLDLYPPRLSSWHVGYELLGFDPSTGAQGTKAPLLELLNRRPVAVVGPLAPAARIYSGQVGLNVQVAVELDRCSQIEDVIDELAAVRDLYDAVLVAAGLPARILCGRLARELGVVALDLGHAFDRLLYVRHGIRGQVEIAARWQAEQYLREALQPPLDPPPELEGRLLRVAGERGVFYVERGRARHVTHRGLLPLLGARTENVAHDVLASLPRGMPLAAVHHRRRGLELLLDGRRVPLRLGVRVAPVDDLPAEVLPVDEDVLNWFPSS